MSTIREVLERKGGTVLTIDRRASVLEAIGTMSKANIGALVIAEGDQPVGIFTERDYLRKIALEGRSSRDTRIEEVMSAPLSMRVEKEAEVQQLSSYIAGSY